MKTRFLLAAVALTLTLFVVSCDNDDDNNNQTPTLNAADVDFLNRFAQSNRGMLALSELARDSSTDQEVRAFAQMMIQDRQNAQRSLDSIATTYQITLPSVGDTASVAYGNILRGTMRGNRFDSSYIANQLTNYDGQLADLNRGSTQGANARVKNYATLQIPVVTQYQAMANVLRQKF